ncbi:MAG: UDP-N-acetylmuramoyl-L-alanyl-D-glutamate-2,6-diaminopimelate ligase [Candidatus Kaiserbacteria bacterium GW2011_GWA2_52_12]|uniref:UDP-N-acetylmuramoyl-L-alanyl-D-glutamate-2, 6-diaminopimelate ligase n=3 Tax=Candidatus Kaiseribacteriota TaxID=1752734 RepID=A0A0G1X0Y5_9BACT|nr:MAG: UDP-N-acetylmuramoyl-L-alanyl-D-glutamate-2,6-diaminopimelate ligase [Candidatus Kaiserbacteria bacterium GW2011_GWA2_52_12]
MYSVKKIVSSLLPTDLFQKVVGGYHWILPHLGAPLYLYPSRKIRVVAVTGTKGKSSTAEMINAIFEEAGEKTAVLNSIRIKVAGDSKPNTLRMSMPGRFFIQRFLSHAVRAGCTTVILEMTSEGARQYRHQCIDLDALVFTNLAPEHIESHGSYKAYAEAKFEIGRQLVRSSKCPRIIVANRDDAEAPRYLSLPVEKHFAFSLSAASPREASEEGGCFTFDGEKITVHLPGEFSLRNALAAATLARAFGVGTSAIAHALDKLTVIPGRGERIAGKQDFTVVVDYAHTPDSLRALYDAYKNKRKICVLGATGGGRDAWKRPVMGKIADENCDEVILTDEDPYDEDPYAIVKMVAKDMKRTPGVIMDRREAIRGALARAKSGDAVLITGKGTDPNICGPRGTKTPWSDADIVREELEKLKAKTV